MLVGYILSGYFRTTFMIWMQLHTEFKRRILFVCTYINYTESLSYSCAETCSYYWCHMSVSTCITYVKSKSICAPFPQWDVYIISLLHLGGMHTNSPQKMWSLIWGERERERRRKWGRAVSRGNTYSIKSQSHPSNQVPYVCRDVRPPGSHAPRQKYEQWGDESR